MSTLIIKKKRLSLWPHPGSSLVLTLSGGSLVLSLSGGSLVLSLSGGSLVLTLSGGSLVLSLSGLMYESIQVVASLEAKGSSQTRYLVIFSKIVNCFMIYFLCFFLPLS